MTDSRDDQVRAFRITGRVQGVGFRWWTRRTAEELGLGGSVRNRSDGSVEVKVAGAEESVEALRSRLERGPSAARVEAVEELAADPNTHRNAFRIER